MEINLLTNLGIGLADVSDRGTPRDPLFSHRRIMLAISYAAASALVLPNVATTIRPSRASVANMAEECKMDASVLDKFMSLPVIAMRV